MVLTGETRRAVFDSACHRSSRSPHERGAVAIRGASARDGAPKSITVSHER
jgi:hypothetical protein